MRDWDEDEVRGETEEGMRHDLHEFAIEKSVDALVAGVISEVEGCTEREERSRDHDQQQVLDHVVAEVLHVKDTNDRFGREERDEKPREEEDRS